MKRGAILGSEKTELSSLIIERKRSLKRRARAGKISHKEKEKEEEKEEEEKKGRR